MSSYDAGRCRREITAAYESTRYKPSDSDMLIADAIDRLAADVAAVMEMTQEIALRVPSEFGQDACDVAVRVALKERDAAVRERDEARAIAADVAEVKAKLDAVSPEDVKHFVESEKAWVALVTEQRDAAIRERDQWREEARLAVVNRDEARAEVERLRAIVHSDAGHMAKILIENERLRAGPAAPQPAGQGISPGLPETQSAGNAAPPAGWLTEEERAVVEDIASKIEQWFKMAWSDIDEKRCAVLRSILARAGAPPVVEGGGT